LFVCFLILRKMYILGLLNYVLPETRNSYSHCLSVCTRKKHTLSLVFFAFHHTSSCHFLSKFLTFQCQFLFFHLPPHLNPIDELLVSTFQLPQKKKKKWYFSRCAGKIKGNVDRPYHISNSSGPISFL